MYRIATLRVDNVRSSSQSYCGISEEKCESVFQQMTHSQSSDKIDCFYNQEKDAYIIYWLRSGSRISKAHKGLKHANGK